LGGVIPPDRLGLARKLLIERQLAADERRELPGGQIALSTLVEAARQALTEDAWFPERSPSEPGHWAVIERRKHGFAVHRCFEIGQLKFSKPTTKRVWRLKKAVRLYVRHYAAGPIKVFGADKMTLGGVPVTRR
jgi:hypothetical protein